MIYFSPLSVVCPYFVPLMLDLAVRWFLFNHELPRWDRIYMKQLISLILPLFFSFVFFLPFLSQSEYF